MKKEITVTGKTVEAAVALGAEQLGVDVSAVTYEVLEAPKKGFLGFGETLAKVKLCYTPTPETVALTFVRTLIADMGIEAEASLSIVTGGKREFLITVSGEEASALIGHHGDTLDSLQYLTNLAANRREEDEEGNYTRITVDIENYRAKREDTLRKLARRMADKALKYRRSVTLEPMNAYERRIIHSEIQNIAGVTTNSIGTDHNRRVVISCEEGARPAKPRTQTPKQPPRTAASRIIPKNKIEKRARFDDTLPEYQLGDSLSEDAAIDYAEAENDTDEI
ncbi:MAG: protein jag [Clostridia bacterium]|nr:protein jag [Clostridia bacterium]